MEILRFDSIKCPYCGTVIDYTLDKNAATFRPIVINCEPDIGGCDKYFAVKFDVTVKHKVFKIVDPADEK